MAVVLDQMCPVQRERVVPRQGTRIAVFRGLRGVGDMLVAGPALRMLRAALPDAHIALIGVEEAHPVISRIGAVYDEFVAFPGWPGLPEGPTAARQLQGRAGRSVPGSPADRVSDIREWCGADVVVQMHGDGSLSNGFCASLEPHMLVAYGPAVTRGPCELHTSEYPRRLHEIDRCLALGVRAAKVLGGSVGPVDRSLEFSITDEDRQEAARLLSGILPEDEPYFVLHPGAHLTDRRWPMDRFAEVGRTLAQRGAVIVTGGEAERTLARETARLIGAGSYSVAGDTTLGAVAALLDGSLGVVTNDTGVSHLADATRTPSVVVFTASDPHRWAPLDRSLHIPVVRPAVDGDEGTLTPEGMRLAVPDVASVLEAAHEVGMIPSEA